MSKRSKDDDSKVYNKRSKPEETFDTFAHHFVHLPRHIDGTKFKAVVEGYFNKERPTCIVYGRRCTVPRDEIMFTDHPAKETYHYSGADSYSRMEI